jgi:hypothetical protein
MGKSDELASFKPNHEQLPKEEPIINPEQEFKIKDVEVSGNSQENEDGS